MIFLAVANLIPVDFALPGGSTMNQLVAQNIEAVEENPDKDNCILYRQSFLSHRTALVKFLNPLFLCQPAIMEIPETTRHILIVDEEADLTGVIFPDNIITDP